jgi:hypothetical protein
MPPLSKGDTFKAFGQHLFFIITNPEENGGKVLAVNATSLRENSDRSCILTRNDHPDIKKNSCIRYNKPIFEESSLIEKLCGGEVIRGRHASDEVIQRIRDGGLKTIHWGDEYKELLKKSKKS